jgi:hypothetical protein
LISSSISPKSSRAGASGPGVIAFLSVPSSISAADFIVVKARSLRPSVNEPCNVAFETEKTFTSKKPILAQLDTALLWKRPAVGQLDSRNQQMYWVRREKPRLNA